MKESFSDQNGDVTTPNNNDSNLSEQPEKTKETFSDGEKELKGHFQKQSNDSNMTDECEKTEESFSVVEKELNEHVQTHSNEANLSKEP